MFCIYGLDAVIILTASLKQTETSGIERNYFFITIEKLLHIEQTLYR